MKKKSMLLQLLKKQNEKNPYLNMSKKTQELYIELEAAII